MAGRPTSPIEFIGEDQVEVLQKKVRDLYDLFIEETDLDAWREIPLDRRENTKRSAHNTLNMIKPLITLIEALCKQYPDNDEASNAAKAMKAQIALFEGKASGKK